MPDRIAHIAVLVVSDRAARGEYDDKGGPAAEAWLRAALASAARITRTIVPDGRETVAATLRDPRRQRLDVGDERSAEAELERPPVRARVDVRAAGRVDEVHGLEDHRAQRRLVDREPRCDLAPSRAFAVVDEEQALLRDDGEARHRRPDQRLRLPASVVTRRHVAKRHCQADVRTLSEQQVAWRNLLR